MTRGGYGNGGCGSRLHVCRRAGVPQRQRRALACGGRAGQAAVREPRGARPHWGYRVATTAESRHQALGALTPREGSFAAAARPSRPAW